MTSSSPEKATRTGWYVVIVLMLAYVSSFIDRQILSLLVGFIKRDMHLTDTQVSLLMGLSFALFYTLLGIPIGRWADRGNRRNIIVLGVLVWSLMTAFCGTVKTYGQFFLARVGVGVGEATLSPAAYSMLADYFPKDKLATAISVYSAGIYIGSGVAVLIGAVLVGFGTDTQTVTLPVIGTVFSWQLLFFYIGLPGILISLLLQTVKEPVRRGLLTNADGRTQTLAVADVFRLIGQKRSAFLSVTLGITFISLVSYASAAWVPTFFVRTFNWKMGQAGLLYGSLVTVFATTGIIMGGRLADSFIKRGRTDGRLRIGIIAALGVLLTSFYPLLNDPMLVGIVLTLPTFFLAFPLGASSTAIQEIMPNQARALASAVYFFILNIIALGFGPTSAALLTDYVFHDEQAIRYSLAIVTFVGALLALGCYSYGLVPYRKAIAEPTWAKNPEMA